MRKWWPLVAICAGTFMLLVDITIVNVALPDMARELHTTFGDLQWVIDLYALVLGALVLTVGSVADRVGRRKLYIVGLVVFALASLTCGVAPNVGLLIAARGVQGLGAAAMFATTMALISSSYQGRDRGLAFGAWGAVIGAASAAGPLAGGLLTTHFGWRWIFLVNLPVSVFAIALTLVVVTESKDPNPRRIDLAGMVTFTVAAASLTYALIHGAWGSAETIGLLAVAVVAAVAFAGVERRIANPMLDLALLRNPAFSALLACGGLFSAAAWAAFTYQSLWLQSALGLSPIKAGLVVVPCSATALVGSLVVGRVMHRWSPGVFVGLGLLVITAGVLAQGVIRSGSSYWVVIPGLAVVGVGAGLVSAPLSSAAMAAVPWQRAGMAGGALNAFRQLGYAMGVAVLGEVFRAGLTHVAGSGLSTALSSGQAQAVIGRTPALAPVVRQAFADGLDCTYVTAAGIGLLGAILALVFVRRRTAAPAAQAAAAESSPAAVEA